MVAGMDDRPCFGQKIFLLETPTSFRQVTAGTVTRALKHDAFGL